MNRKNYELKKGSKEVHWYPGKNEKKEQCF